MDNFSPETRRRLDGYFHKHGAALIQDLGFDPVTVWVFFYLFERLVYGKEATCSTQDVYKCLKAQFSTSLLRNKNNVNEKNVAKALATLSYLGMTTTVKPSPQRKRGDPKRSGRPPNTLHKLVAVREIMKKLESSIEERKRRVLTVFNEIADVEEATGMKSTEKEVAK